ncbi:MAG TPA: ABC transporter substrate-binding protein, partial [Anaerolineales bacterium]|nr:ABC transporter substrate-binding protein [Anaerolineales bacterium]
MRTKLFGVIAFLMLASLVIAACAPAQGAVQTVIVAGTPMVVTATPEVLAIKSADPTTFTKVTYGDPQTLDPALDYETAGAEILQNVYETLVFYKGEDPSSFVPQLASDWTVSADGKTYTFTMRPGVKFHDGADMTASDAAYSWQRGILQGGGDSPQWMMVSSVAGLQYSDIAELVDPSGALIDDPAGLKAADPAALKAACDLITKAIVADDAAGTLTVTLAQPFAPFLSIIAQTWGSVMDKDWTVKNGGWDGSCDTWQNWYGTLPENDPFTSITNGTGPFKLDHWTPGEEIVAVRNDSYWRTDPAYDGGPSGLPALERVVIKNVAEFGTRFAMFQAGDADYITVNPEQRPQVDPLVGERCQWDEAANAYAPCDVTDASKPFRLYIGKPGATHTDVFFNFNVANPNGNNVYLGSGKLDGNGIPTDFFADPHIRKAMNYCFDWDTYINDIFSGEAVQTYTIPVAGMAGYDVNAPHYSYDPAKCEAEFKAADVDKDGIAAGDDPEGDVWTTGFRMQIGYNQGNTTRQAVAEILASGLTAVNDKFLVETIGLPWPSFLAARTARTLPVFVLGWLEDYHDPHNWYQPYLVGNFGSYLRMPEELSKQFGDLITAAASETDPAKRADIYGQVNQLVYDNAPFILLATGTSHNFWQRWVQGI